MSAIHNDCWDKSRELLNRARKSLAGGVSSPFRARAPIPLYLTEAEGSRIRDADGNTYIDYSLAWGPLILGHKHPALVERLQQQAGRPHIYGAQHELEFQVAEAFQKVIPCAERVAFTSSGSEAVQAIWRIARAATGRTLILKFEGHYHGWMDSTLFSYKPSAAQLASAPRGRPLPGSRGQVPNASENVVIAEWNNLESVDELFRRYPGEIAGVIAEPVACNSGCIDADPGFLSELAKLTRKNGAVLMFDEVITGFRHPGLSAQKFYGVTPDLASFGKALGGGVPLSAFAGRAELMDLMFTGGVSFGGTFNGNPLSLAAADVVLGQLTANDGAALTAANARGVELIGGIRERAHRHRLDALITGFGAAFAIHFTRRNNLRNYRDTLDDDAEMLHEFLLEGLRHGLNLVPDGRMYISMAHTDADVEETRDAFDRIFCALARRAKQC